MRTTFVLMSIALAVVFVATGLPKILNRPRSRERARHLGYSSRAFRVIGTLELAAAVGLIAGLVRPLPGIAAAIGLVMLLVGAVIAHRRAGDRVAALLPPGWLAVVAAATAGVGIAEL